MPTELDEASRRMMQLEIEREALQERDRRRSKQRLEKIENELASCASRPTRCARAGSRKGRRRSAARAARADRATKTEIERASQSYDLNRKAAELKYGVWPSSSAQLHAKEAALDRRSRALLKEEVDEEDIADVVSRWTGIPVSSCSKARCRSCCTSTKSCTSA
jgi:ATP-dependent Clp protease ATP-binding subunit ClpB